MASASESTTSLPKTKHTRSASRGSRSQSLRKVEVKINVYDLLPPGHVASIIWFLGTPLLHTGVVIGDKEYAYGGHNRANTSGVYWTRPQIEPPGATFRTELLHGFIFLPQNEIDTIIEEVSSRFLGPNYNVLKNNCNHFTAHLCERLTHKQPPAWLNRAASVGIVFPCVVPRNWIDPPSMLPDDGELIDLEDADEHMPMLLNSERR